MRINLSVCGTLKNMKIIYDPLTLLEHVATWEDFPLLNPMVGEVFQEYLSMYSWSILRFHLDLTSPSFVHLVQTLLFPSSTRQKSLRGQGEI
jgi:hypothetical protein